MTTTSPTSQRATVTNVSEIEAMHSTLRRGIVVCVISTMLMAAIFIYYSIRIESTSNAREQLIIEQRANSTSRRIASSILLQVELARVQENASDMWLYLDQIETLANNVLIGEDDANVVE